MARLPHSFAAKGSRCAAGLRWLLRCLACAAISAACTAGLALWWVRSQMVATYQPPTFARLHLPESEHRCYAACLPDYAPEPSLRSASPVVRLRENGAGGYELLYWGNPVRPAYAYSIRAHRGRQSVLLNAQGAEQSSRPLPVTAPKRKDGRLPLQPPVPLARLKGAPGELYAARISVHDARTGGVLCWADYLLSGNDPPPR